jgi:hypothetical protein
MDMKPPLYNEILKDPEYWGHNWHIHALEANVDWFLERKSWEDAGPIGNCWWIDNQMLANTEYWVLIELLTQGGWANG